MAKVHGGSGGNVGSSMGKGVGKKGSSKGTRPPLGGPAKDIKWPTAARPKKKG